MHLTKLAIRAADFPTREFYPFHLEVFHATPQLEFTAPVTFFVGENGTGKSTLLRAVAQKCGISIWKEAERRQYHPNKYAADLHKYIELDWVSEKMLGSFFGSEIFQTFATILDEWATADPGILKYFGGESLVAKSHGQCNLSYFKSRYQYKGLHLLDEPETALSPQKQIEFLNVLRETCQTGTVQFIIATHSPLLLAYPGAVIYSFDYTPVRRIEYEETDYYRVYKAFLNDPAQYLQGVPSQANPD